jgi:hypothetical protein
LSKESPNSSWKALNLQSFAAWAATAAALRDLAIVCIKIIDAWAATFTFTVGPCALPGAKPRGVRVAQVVAGPVDVAVQPIAWPIALPVVKPGGVRVTSIVAARVVPGGELGLGHGGGQAAAAWLQLSHGGGRRQLPIAGGLAFCGWLKMELIGWIATVFRVINKEAT